MSETHEILSSGSDLSSDEYSSDEENDSRLIQTALRNRERNRELEAAVAAAIGSDASLSNDAREAEAEVDAQDVAESLAEAWRQKKAVMRQRSMDQNKNMEAVYCRKKKAVYFLRSKSSRAKLAERIRQTIRSLRQSHAAAASAKLKLDARAAAGSPASNKSASPLSRSFSNGVSGWSVKKQQWEIAEILCTPENKQQRLPNIYKDSPWPASCLDEVETRALRASQLAMIESKSQKAAKPLELVCLTDSDDEGPNDEPVKKAMQQPPIRQQTTNTTPTHIPNTATKMNGFAFHINQIMSLNNQQSQPQQQQETLSKCNSRAAAQPDSTYKSSPKYDVEDVEMLVDTCDFDEVAEVQMKKNDFVDRVKKRIQETTKVEKAQQVTETTQADADPPVVAAANETSAAHSVETTRPKTLKRTRAEAEIENTSETEDDIGNPRTKRPTISSFWENITSIYPLYRQTISDAVENAHCYEDFLETRIQCLERSIKSSDSKMEALLQEYGKHNFFKSMMVETVARLKFQLDAVKSREIFNTFNLSQLDDLNKFMEHTKAEKHPTTLEDILKALTQKQTVVDAQPVPEPDERPITAKDLKNLLASYQQETSPHRPDTQNVSAYMRPTFANGNISALSNGADPHNLSSCSSANVQPSRREHQESASSIIYDMLEKLYRLKSAEVDSKPTSSTNEQRHGRYNNSPPQTSTAATAQATATTERRSATSSQLIKQKESFTKPHSKRSPSPTIWSQLAQQKPHFNGAANMEESKNCHKCQKPNATYACNYCRQVLYCNELCQLIDYRHTNVCRPPQQPGRDFIRAHCKPWY